MMTNSKSMAPSGEFVEIYDYLVKHNADINITNAMHHITHYVKTRIT